MILAQVALSAGIALILCLVLTPLLIPVLRRLKFGQSILEIGPSWHQKKSGTPTMGGIAIIIAAVLGALLGVFVPGTSASHVSVLVLGSLCFGLIGFFDDYIKVFKKRNLGLTSKQKFLAQVLVACVFVAVMSHTGLLGGEIFVPVIKKNIDVGLFSLPLVLFVLLALVNSVNLTDGLDGLATTVTMIVALFLTVCAIKLKNIPVAVFEAAVFSSCLGFLFFNANPAKVFMGDTGSLFLGGAIAFGACALKLPLILIIAGFVYLAETLSVMIQVTSFKLTGKRVFKMSPIHHHFEMCGMGEKKIVFYFALVTVLLCAVSYLIVF